MKTVKYLFAIWAGILVYCLLTLVFGPGGFSAYRQLSLEQEKLEANIESLRIVNHELENSMNSLLYDTDTIALHARGQGYAHERERFIRIVGLGVNYNPRISPGEPFLAAEPQHSEPSVLRIIAVSAGITIFICMGMFDFLKFIREN